MRLRRFARSLTVLEVRSGPTRDGEGRAVPGTSRLVEGCRVHPGVSTAEGGILNDLSEDYATAFLPKGTVLGHSDRVIVPAGHRLAGVWELVGEPSRWFDRQAVQLHRIT